MDQSMKPKTSALTATLITILVILIFAGGTYFYMNDKAEKEKSDLNAQIAELQNQISALKTSATSSSSTGTTTDVTANWKTYTNDTYGFSFKYPSNWTAKVLDNSSVELSQNGKKYEVEGSGVAPISAKLELNGASDISSALDIAKARKITTDIGTPTTEVYKMTGFDAARGSDYLKTVTYVKLSNGNLFTLTLVNNGVDADQKTLGAICDEILSTFQFTK